MAGDWGPDTGRLSRRRALMLGGAAAVTALSARGLPGNASEPEPLAGPISRLHDEGATGAGVRVGVLDTTGFAAEHPAFGDAVVGRRSFDGAPVVADGTTHGTAAAATVSRIAPDADLLFASFARPAGFERALGWFRATGVDVVLAPVAAYGASVTDDSPVTSAAAAAVGDDVTVVAPTGNAARGHWQGRLSPTADPRRIDVARLPGREGTDRLLAWGGTTAADVPAVSLSLVRVDGRERELVALSEPAEQTGVERLRVDLGEGRHVLRVSLPEGEAGADAGTEHPAAVTTPTHRLEPSAPGGSIAAPASARGVLAVGRLSTDGPAAYSGRGPTADGRYGVDVVARPRHWPTSADPGTSGAAARVAGVAALVAAAAPDSASTDPEAIIRATASRADDPTTTVGYGGLDAVGAVRRAGER